MKSEDQDEVPQNAAFHQDLHFLLRQNRSYEYRLEIISLMYSVPFNHSCPSRILTDLCHTLREKNVYELKNVDILTIIYIQSKNVYTCIVKLVYILVIYTFVHSICATCQ